MSDKEIYELNLKNAAHYGAQLQMNQFTEELALDGVADRIEAYKDDYQRGILNERSYSIERMFEAAYKMAYPPHGCRGRQHDSWGTCIDLVHAIEHQQCGWTVRKTSGKSRAQQTVLSNLFRWGMSRSRKLRGWKNELPVL